MLTRLLITYLCNLLDIVATLHLSATQNGEELNPIAAWLLQFPPLFVTVKMVVMTTAVAFMWWKRDWRLCEIASWILCIEYLLVACYYLIVYMFLL